MLAWIATAMVAMSSNLTARCFEHPRNPLQWGVFHWKLDYIKANGMILTLFDILLYFGGTLIFLILIWIFTESMGQVIYFALILVLIYCIFLIFPNMTPDINSWGNQAKEQAKSK
jgi:hypothetical protein